MNLEEIENLSTEQVDDFYRDIVDFSEDTRLAGCCCFGGAFRGTDGRAHCTSWCRFFSRACPGWMYNYVLNCCDFSS